MSIHDVVVATIGKAHGLRGELSLILRTDRPADRFARGAAFTVRHDGADRTLTVESARTQKDRWYVRFAEVTSRTDAESLRGIELEAQVDPEDDDDPDAWYPDELTGLTVRHVDGRELGTVTGLEHYPAQDLLIVRGTDGRRVMLPFVEELVPEVDTEAGIVLADPPGGLFEDLDDNADEDPDAAATAER
ncbi:MAG: ribosome maturation factor RimM [Brachybacterium sp.]|nr:ribosome maturation factor RimM [Brachybacterium sp.]